jgi:hypothetical protein
MARCGRTRRGRTGSVRRTWVDDACPEDGEAAERALAREERNAVKAAYARSIMFTRRVMLMAAWADQCGARSRTPTTDTGTEGSAA